MRIVETFTYSNSVLAFMADEIDELILSTLSKDSRQDSAEVWDFLRGFGHNISREEIESRISKLTEEGVITGYSITINPKKIPQRIIRTALLTFKVSQSLKKRTESLEKYLKDAPFVVFSGSTKGGLDWITIRAFPSVDIADEETDIFRNLFGDIIQTYQVYDFVPTKEVSLHALSYTRKEHKEFLKEWMPPFL
jgi:Lrp/AsnC family leucine-responsive transcriptional regulator